MFPPTATVKIKFFSVAFFIYKYGDAITPRKFALRPRIHSNLFILLRVPFPSLEKTFQLCYNMYMVKDKKIIIRNVQECDRDFWFLLDAHLSAEQFQFKVRDKQGYVLLSDGVPSGILRYNLFWDNTPFCNLLYIKESCRRQGYGKTLMLFWEREMLAQGYKLLLVSTQSDEDAQYFYRKTGYSPCGNINLPGQTTELFFEKQLTGSIQL